MLKLNLLEFGFTHYQPLIHHITLVIMILAKLVFSDAVIWFILAVHFVGESTGTQLFRQIIPETGRWEREKGQCFMSGTQHINIVLIIL